MASTPPRQVSPDLPLSAYSFPGPVKQPAGTSKAQTQSKGSNPKVPVNKVVSKPKVPVNKVVSKPK
jgi:hypothetical protein